MASISCSHNEPYKPPSMMREPEMQEWVSGMKPEEKKRCKLTEEMSTALDRFFFNHYCHAFRSGAFARANSSMYVPLDFYKHCLPTSETDQW